MIVSAETSVQVGGESLVIELSRRRLILCELLQYHFSSGHIDILLLEVLPQLIEGDIVLIVADILECLQEFLLLGLAVLFFDHEAVEEVFLGEFRLVAGGVDCFFDDAYFAVAHGDGDEVEEHLDVLAHGLVGLAGDAHPVVEEGELLAVLAVVDHRNYNIRWISILKNHEKMIILNLLEDLLKIHL